MRKDQRVARASMTAVLKSDRLPRSRTGRDSTLFDNQNDEWLTSREAAAFLKISEGCLRNLCSNGQIPYHKLARRNRYRLQDLRDLLLKTRKGGSHVN